MKLTLKPCGETSSLFKPQNCHLCSPANATHPIDTPLRFSLLRYTTTKEPSASTSRHLGSIYKRPLSPPRNHKHLRGTETQTSHTTRHPAHKKEAMGRITCSECDFRGCRDSCLDDHEREFACHNKLCPLHIEYFVAVRHGKFLRRGKRSSSRRRESEDLPHRSSDRPRHSSRRHRSLSRRRSNGDRLFTRVLDRVMRRRDTTSVDDGDDNRGRVPTVSVRIRQSTRHVRRQDEGDNGGPGPSTSARIRRGTRYVRTQDDSASGSSCSTCSSCSSDSDEEEWESAGRRESRGRREGAGRPSSSHQYSSTSSTRPPPPAAGYPGHQGSSRRRSPRPSTPRPASYPAGNGTGTSSHPGGNDRGGPEPPSPPLKTNWRVR